MWSLALFLWRLLWRILYQKMLRIWLYWGSRHFGSLWIWGWVNILRKKHVLFLKTLWFRNLLFSHFFFLGWQLNRFSFLWFLIRFLVIIEVHYQNIFVFGWLLLNFRLDIWICGLFFIFSQRHLFEKWRKLFFRLDFFLRIILLAFVTDLNMIIFIRVWTWIIKKLKTQIGFFLNC